MQKKEVTVATSAREWPAGDGVSQDGKQRDRDSQKKKNQEVNALRCFQWRLEVNIPGTMKQRLRPSPPLFAAVTCVSVEP